MDVKFQFADVDKVKVSLTLTATVGELRFLRSHSDVVLGNSEFRDILADVVDQAEQAFYAKTDA